MFWLAGTVIVFKNFAKPDLAGEARFEGLECKSANEYGPVLSSAISYMGCRVQKHVPAGESRAHNC